jgi:hypothetical protein
LDSGVGIPNLLFKGGRTALDLQKSFRHCLGVTARQPRAHELACNSSHATRHSVSSGLQLLQLTSRQSDRYQWCATSHSLSMTRKIDKSCTRARGESRIEATGGLFFAN